MTSERVTPTSGAVPRARARILIVEDNADLAAGIAYNLELEGHDVVVAGDGRSALEVHDAYHPDIVLLDLMLPALDGYEVLRKIRAGGHRTPVIILSARAEEADKVRGFRLDADQYVTKPFGVIELIERVASVLRRADIGATASGAIRFGDISVDVGRRVVSKAEQEVALSPKAFELLLALLQRNGAVATRDELLREVWGYGVAVVSRTVDTHVAELRRKLEEDAADPQYIVTVWKLGYRIPR